MSPHLECPDDPEMDDQSVTEPLPESNEDIGLGDESGPGNDGSAAESASGVTEGTGDDDGTAPHHRANSEKANKQDVAKLVLFEAREKRRLQDERLGFERRLGFLVFGTFLSLSTLAVSASNNKSEDIATAVFWFGVPLAVTLMLSQYPLMKWSEASKIPYLVENYYEPGVERHVMEKELAEALEREYEHNEDLLLTVSVWVMVEFLVASTAVGWVTGILLS